jgi:hypothetical protein
MKRYTYRPLRAAPYSTRLLRILPGVEGSALHCLIIDYTIEGCQGSGPYEALSYVWGNAKETRRVYVRNANHHRPHRKALSYLDITFNLYDALQRLRSATFSRLMWIDAVCIDQLNLREQAAQVKFMATIYLYASRVIVWLGEEADNSTSILADIEHRAMESRHRLRYATSLASNYANASSSSQEQSVAMNNSLAALIRRPWFHRIWV